VIEQDASRRVVVATIGHVDHGKTSLVKALTGIDTDRLPDEKRRGITLELGFAPLPESSVSFIDVPGHERLVHSMIAGVGGVDAVLLAVAADDGVMPQTREHLYVCRLLGVSRVIVALTKSDLVDAETLELAEADLDAALAEIGLERSATIRTSVLTGQGVPELRSALLRVAGEVPARSASSRPWLAIDRVFTVHGSGTVVTGTLTRGRLTQGRAVLVVGATTRHASSCRALQVHGAAVSHVDAPARVAVNLAKLDVTEVSRGDALTGDLGAAATTGFDMTLSTVDDAVFQHRAALVHIGTARAAGRVSLIADGFAHVVLEQPLPCAPGLGVVLRGFTKHKRSGRVVAGGRVIDAFAPALPRKRDKVRSELRARSLRAMSQGDVAAGLEALMLLAAPRPLSAEDAERRFGLEPGEVARVLAAKPKKRQRAAAASLAQGKLWTQASVIAEAEARLVAEVRRYHEQHPGELGVPLQTLRSAVSTRAGEELAELALERACRGERLLLLPQGVICDPEFNERQGPEARQRSEKLLGIVDRAALQGVSEAMLQAESAEPIQTLRSALGELAGRGVARRLGDLWFAERHLDDLRNKVKKYFSEQAVLSVGAFKDLALVSRKQAIPLLEQLDREGTTRRRGDDRIEGAQSKRERESK
jgi:selenocysteine-specific elongation factor